MSNVFQFPKPLGGGRASGGDVSQDTSSPDFFLNKAISEFASASQTQSMAVCIPRLRLRLDRVVEMRVAEALQAKGIEP